MLAWAAHPTAALPLSPGHHVVRTADELAHMVNALRGAPERAFDFETTGLRFADPRVKPIGYGVGYIDGQNRHWSWYVPFGHLTAEPQANPDQARRAFVDALAGAAALIGHNLKFDLNIARAAGLDVPDVPLHDTLPQAHLIYEQRPLDLESVCADTRGASLWDPYETKSTVEAFTQGRAKLRGLPWKKDRPADGVRSYLSQYGHGEVPIGIEAEYTCRDIGHTLLLDRAQRREAMGIGADYEIRRRALYENEMLLVRALADMEWEGQPVDADYLQTLAESWTSARGTWTRCSGRRSSGTTRTPCACSCTSGSRCP